MGAFCCCLCPEDFEEHAHTSNPIYRQCICLRYFFHQLLNGYGAMFQRLDGRSVPSQIQTATSSTSTTAGNTYDNSLCESHHLVPRPPPYEADPRYAREGLISRREKSMSHIQEDLQTLRRNGSSSAVETLAAVRKRIAETEVGQKLIHAESEKNLAAKTRDTGFVFTTSEDEDVCPTCLEEYSSENPKIVAKCSHHFHLSCIYEWMERSDSCPVCGKTPCGHNFCLKCFQKWVGQGKHSCAKCRAPIPSKMACEPRINSAIVVAIRMAKTAQSTIPSDKKREYHSMCNENRPDKAFTTERAKKAGKANACSGQIFVAVPPDHFGPILAVHDPKRKKGVLVGEIWEDRLECRQWGAHLPHVAGIAGQSNQGAQSVALSGGYKDDEDHGDWFLYTGSGGRDLSGNKRTNKHQSFDQTFEKLNKALQVSCLKGYPVRVVRSHKEKRSSYAPETGVRYDGIYRIEKCWRKVGIQGFKVCRYLFVRCDNEPAPWTSDEQGDHPRPLPVIKELKHATDITIRKQSPSWDYDEKHGWKWIKSPPTSRKHGPGGSPYERGRRKSSRTPQSTSVREKLLKELSCLICWKVMSFPLTTPCAHNFCKSCLLGSFADKSFVRERTWEGGWSLRAQKIIKKCPSCPNDISDFLQNPQVNRELMDLIELLQKRKHEMNGEESSEETSNLVDLSSEEENNDQEKRLRNYGSDLGKNMVENESDVLKGKKLKGKAFDICEQQYKSVDGESETYAVNCEMDEIGKTYCLGLRNKVVHCVTYKRRKTNYTLNGIHKTRSLGLTNKVVHYVTYKRRKLNCEMDEIGKTSCLGLTNKVVHYVTYKRRKLPCEMDEIGKTSCLGLTNKVVHYVTYKRRKTNCEMDKIDKTSCVGLTNKVVHYVTYKRRNTNYQMDKIDKINCLGLTSKVVRYVTYKRRKTNPDSWKK